MRDLAVQRSYGVSVVLGLAAGALGLASYFFIGRLVDPGHPELRGPYFPFVCTGFCVQIAAASALGALGGALARESREGTLEPAFAAGASPFAVIVGGALTPLALAFLQIGVCLSAGAILLGLDLEGARWLPALASLAATLVACAPVGLTGAAAWLLVRRPGAVTTLAAFAFGVLGGVYFPIAVLPAPLAQAAAWLPITGGVEMVRAALLEGAGWTDTAVRGWRLAVVAAATLPPALLILRFALRRARHLGSPAPV